MWKISQTKGKASEKFPKLTAVEKDGNMGSREVEESTALAFQNQVIPRTFDTNTNCSGDSKNHKLATSDNSGCTSLATKDPPSSTPAVKSRVKKQQGMLQTREGPCYRKRWLRHKTLKAKSEMAQKCCTVAPLEFWPFSSFHICKSLQMTKRTMKQLFLLSCITTIQLSVRKKKI